MGVEAFASQAQEDPRKTLRWLASAFVGASLGKVFLLWLKMFRIKRMLRDVPRARYTDGVFGIVPDMMQNTHRLIDWRTDITRGLPVSKSFGAFFMPATAVLYCHDPRMVKHFLKDAFESYTKPSKRNDMEWYFINQWLGKGIFTARHGPNSEDQGKSWALQRKIAANIFSRGNFNSNMHQVFVTKAEAVCRLLEASATEGAKVDVQAMAFAYTMDSIMQIFFGEKTNSIGGEPSAYAQAFDASHKNLVDYVLGNAAFLLCTQDLLVWPIGSTGGLAWIVHAMLSKTYGKFQAAARILDQESSRLVAQVRADPRRDERRDLLALFVSQEEKQRFSTEFLRDVVLNFVLAGRDTTACLLSWTFYELAINPEVQQRLCEEVDRKLPAGTMPTLTGVSQGEMPFLHGVVYEALRLHPPVPYDGKVAIADNVLPDGTRVPAGVSLSFMPYATGRDPTTYPDPLAFKPERWVPFKAPLPHEFPVFQAGPRICLGMDMAIFEAKVFVTTMLQRLSFTLLPGERIWHSNGLTTSCCNKENQSSNNLWLLPKKRW